MAAQANEREREAVRDDGRTLFRQFPDEADHGYLETNVLEAREPVLWVGRPSRWLMFWKGSLGIPVGLYFMGFGLLNVGLIFGLFPFREMGLFSLIGLAIFLFGLVTFTTPIRAYRSAGRTLYVITDRRVIVYVRGWTTRVTQMYASDISKFEVIDKGGDRGSIRLRHRTLPGLSWLRFPFMKPEVDSGLWGIKDLKKASVRIRAIKSGGDKAE